MKAFNGTLEDGSTVEITHNDGNTHFYIDNKRIPAKLAIKAKEAYEAEVIVEKKPEAVTPVAKAEKPAKEEKEVKTLTPKKEKVEVVVETGLNAEQTIVKVQNTTSTHEKKALIAGNITPELIFLLNLNKKESKGKGISLARYNAFVEKCKVSENKDIIEAYKQVNRSAEFRPTQLAFITALNGEKGNIVRFEINTAEKFGVMSAIPTGKEELYLNAISKNLKLGLSDKVIDELLS